MRLFSKLALILTLTLGVIVPAYGSLVFRNGSDVDLGPVSKAKCSTGITCVITGGQLVMTASALTDPITMSNGEILTNATLNDTVSVLSNSEVMTFNILGFEAKGAVLQLWADQGDDVPDKFSLSASTSNELSIINGVTTLLKFDSAGVQYLADSETLTNASDVVSIGFDDAAANVKLVGFEATKSSLTLQADESDDNGDDWQVTSEVANTFTIANDTSGAFVAKMTIDTTGNVTGPGAGAMSGFLQKQVASTTVAITAAQCGSTFVSDSTDVLTLPEASTVLGCRLTFVCGTADDLDINPADGVDVIGITGSITGANTTTVLAPAAGDAIRCTDIGAGFQLEAVGANLWAVLHTNGIITDVN